MPRPRTGEGRPLWGRAGYTALHGARLSSVLSGDQSANPASVPDSAIELTGFSVHRSDRAKELTGKSRGGGVCFYINNLWCDERNIHSIKSFCSPDLEFHTLLCRPFWLPREFTAIIITAVYIPPPPKPTQTRHSRNCTGI